MKILAIIDPPSALQPTTDTTLVILRELQHRGYQPWVCQPQDISLDGNIPMCDAYEVTHINLTQKPALLVAESPVTSPVETFQAVLIRKDPPFDSMYLWMTLMLEYARAKTVLYNDPRGLREANEKLYIFHFPTLIAPTIVHRNQQVIKQFLHSQGGQIVIKPIDGFGGQGIFHVRTDDPNTNVIIETATHDGQRPVMAQKYLPAVREGDKRIILLDGKPLGALLRLPQGHDTRSNLRAGGTAVQTQITPSDLDICSTIAPRLRQDGLYLVGIDIIGGYVSEINVTSPTGVQVINRLEQTKLERHIADDIQRRIQQLHI